MFKKLLSTIIVLSIFFQAVAFPVQDVYARNIFKDVFRFVKNTTKFVVTLPDKATRFLGPQLGPVASFILTKNIMKNPKIAKIFTKANKVKNITDRIDNIKDHVDELKGVYKSEAQKLRAQATELENIRKQYAQGLLKGDDLQEYLANVADIQKVIEAHNAAADKLEASANNLGPEQFIKILGNDFIDKTMGDFKDAIMLNVASDLTKITDPVLIQSLFEGKANFNDILNFFVDRELEEALYGEDYSDDEKADLRDQIRQSIKDEWDKNRDDLKNNWDSKIHDIINNAIKEANTLSEEQQNLVDKFEEQVDEVKEGKDWDMDIGDCPPGYRFNPRSGVGCQQINCNEVDEASHYSYTGRCICGSAGSINENPDDPNKVCSFPKQYESCPGCVYACVHTDEDCPLDGIRVY